MVFKFAYFVEFTKGYQPAKFQCCRLPGSRFSERLQKHNDDVILTTLYILGFEKPRGRLELEIILQPTREIVETAALFFYHIKLWLCFKLLPQACTRFKSTFSPVKFSTVSKDEINDFYLIYDKLSAKSYIILSIHPKILCRYQKAFDN